jgi:uncharacterized protein YbcI
VLPCSPSGGRGELRMTRRRQRYTIEGWPRVPGGPRQTSEDLLKANQESDLSASEQSASGSAKRLQGGQLLSEISTSIVKLMREHYGRGPLKAKTYALDDIIVCVLRGAGFTALEQTIMDSGDGERVVAMRENFQHMMAERYKAMIEQLTDRRVLAFLSQAHVEPDLTLEVFFIDRPLDSFGSAEVGPTGAPSMQDE